MSSSSIHFSTKARVSSDISNRTGFCVLLFSTDARSLIWLDAITSTTFIFTKSHPRSLLSIAMLNRARLRWFSASSSRTRIARTCFGFSGHFWPTIRPLFQAGQSARMAGMFGVSMTDPPIRHAPHNDSPTLPRSAYHVIWCSFGRQVIEPSFTDVAYSFNVSGQLAVEPELIASELLDLYFFAFNIRCFEHVFHR